MHNTYKFHAHVLHKRSKSLAETFIPPPGREEVTQTLLCQREGHGVCDLLLVPDAWDLRVEKQVVFSVRERQRRLRVYVQNF